MNTYKQQSKKPKPQPADQVVERFKKSMKELGYDVTVEFCTSPYAPAVSIEVWRKRREEAA